MARPPRPNAKFTTRFIDTELGPIVAVNGHTRGAQIRVTFNDVILNVKETERVIDALIDTLPNANLLRLARILDEMRCGIQQQQDEK